MAPLLELRGVVKRFGRRVAVDGVSLAVGPSELLGLVGPNGAGKTTLLRISLGILRRDSGEVYLMGDDPFVNPRTRERVGVIFERPSLPPAMPVRLMLERAARIVGASREDVSRAIDLVGLRGHEDKPFAHLSAGLKQRAAIAHALLPNPDLIVADEPTSNLDPVEREEVLGLLVRLKKEEGVSVLLSSHVLSEVVRVVDALAIMKSGRIEAAGSPDEVLRGRRLARVRAQEPEALAKALSGAGFRARVSGQEVVVELGQGADEPSLLSELSKLMASGLRVYGLDFVEAAIEEMLR